MPAGRIMYKCLSAAADRTAIHDDQMKKPRREPGLFDLKN